MQHNQRLIWAGRALIGFVLFFNVQCALFFLVSPEQFAPGFELEGVVGSAMVRGMGILFLMWNVPYVFALAHPVRWRVSLYEAIVMQAIGVVGESLLLQSLPSGHPLIQASVSRFIQFDGAGLLFLLLSLELTRRLNVRSAV